MELWGWLAGYVLLFALLHLALFYYYSRQESDDRRPARALDDGPLSNVRYGAPVDRSHTGAERADPSEFDLEIEGEAVECPRCGAPNESDSTYTYCWNCISTLG
ncbi:DUF7577 domain-containing protein [Halovivax limisalsi]|uniref:DUF7577 domain-containing protein n=1 Tax=Halovivax limisalsi TaxID=1453760 RepID=UPI001FFC9EC4|nr:hypothetical protein [Halovivax limisalsi]